MRIISRRVPAPGMQRPKEANICGAKVLVIGQQDSNRLAAGVKDCIVAIALMGAQQRTKFLGNRKRHNKLLGNSRGTVGSANFAVIRLKIRQNLQDIRFQPLF